MEAWLTLEEIKAYLKITDTLQDADITFQLDKFRAQTRVINYINRDEDYVLTIDYEQSFAKYVLSLVNDMKVDENGGRVVKTWAFDGESKTYEDATGDSNSIIALSSFNPLRRVWA